jgi:methionyl-tRNA formyltransferase
MTTSRFHRPPIDDEDTRRRSARLPGTEDDMAVKRGRVVFAGAVHEARPALRALLDGSACEVCAVVTPPAGLAARMCGYVDLVPLARRRGVPVLHAADINAPATVARIRALAPDLLVVIGWSRLIGPELLSLPPRGCVGTHASLLPRHRGRAPVNWSIIRGETVTGNTLMLLGDGADTGDIVAQQAIPIEPEDTCATVYTKVGAAGADMLRRHLPALLAGTAPRRPQRAGDGDLLPKRTPEMGITDWNRPAQALHDWIRGQTRPYPGAFTRLHGDPVMLWRSRPPADGMGGPALPGTVLAVGPDGVTVATPAGPLTVTELCGAGQPAMPAAAWCHAAGVSAGTRFDPVDAATARWALGAGPRPVSAGARAS